MNSKVSKNPKSPFRQRTEAYPGKAGDLKVTVTRTLPGNESEGLAPGTDVTGKIPASYVRVVPDGGHREMGTPASGDDMSQGDADSVLDLGIPTMSTIGGMAEPPSPDAIEYRPVTEGGYDYLGHFANPSVLREGHNNMSLEEAFHEEKINPPKVLAKTRAKSGAAQANKQRVAIAFSKAGQSRKGY